MTIKQAMAHAAQMLLAAGVPDPHIDAELMLSYVTGVPRMMLRLTREQDLTQEQEQRFSSLLLSRASREPLQYLLGTQNFFGLDFQVDGRVLIPRQETETLCELGIMHLRKLTDQASALDLCTGSGAIAITLKHECPRTAVTAADLSGDALSLARHNAALNGTNVRFVQGDLFAPLAGERFDLILSNPPYIPAAECDSLQPEVMREPRMALDGGFDGFDFYRRIAAEAPLHLTPRGLLAVEAGDRQAQGIADLFTAAGFAQVCIHNDLYGLPRVVSAVNPT